MKISSPQIISVIFTKDSQMKAAKLVEVEKIYLCKIIT